MECEVDAAATTDRRLFHALAAATRNSRSASDDLLAAGTTSAGELTFAGMLLKQCMKIYVGSTEDKIGSDTLPTTQTKLQHAVRCH